MTSAASPTYEEYPRYCYHLSPTITKWCPLRASDIKELRWHPGFQGQDDTFFRLNHPIRWVRIVGVVVAIDSYYGRQVYTVDDSTGMCIECSLDIPTPADSDERKGSGDAQKEPTEIQPPGPHPEIDVGMVIEVKGSLKLFRYEKQIKIGKMQRIRSTTQEVQFWGKIRAFRRDVLSQPWVVDRKVLRTLEKENKTDLHSKEEEKRRRKQQQEAARSGEAGKHRSLSGRAVRDHGLKKPYQASKLRSVTTVGGGQYDALGL
ncbi:hypothetical protein BJ170DRAFT_607109 [Xylariales sp. AK1849]|nr:hypothetical protein BJ170DRAFT_607109 [Xylariales sp. AK1849]